MLNILDIEYVKRIIIHRLLIKALFCVIICLVLLDSCLLE